jgi:hypothetical protein
MPRREALVVTLRSGQTHLLRLRKQLQLLIIRQNFDATAFGACVVPNGAKPDARISTFRTTARAGATQNDIIQLTRKGHAQHQTAFAADLVYSCSIHPASRDQVILVAVVFSGAAAEILAKL